MDKVPERKKFNLKVNKFTVNPVEKEGAQNTQEE